LDETGWGGPSYTSEPERVRTHPVPTVRLRKGKHATYDLLFSKYVPRIFLFFHHIKMKSLKMLLKGFGRPTIKQRRLRIIRSSQRYSRSFTNSMCTHESHDSSNDFFRYTSGRWLYDEQIQLRRRYLEFNIQALTECASRELGTRCVRISKLPEGLYNKVFSLKMEDGREVLARIPNPNAGYPDDIVSSEVATLDFV
jgi:hypothetical protein